MANANAGAKSAEDLKNHHPKVDASHITVEIKASMVNGPETISNSREQGIARRGWCKLRFFPGPIGS